LLPERLRPPPGAGRSFLVGLALGVLLLTAGSLLLSESGAALPAAAGLVATFAVSLAAGMWAGAPGARAGGSPTGRWILASLALGLAGLGGTAWTVLDGAHRGGLVRALALLVLVGIPVYAIGLLLPAMAVHAVSASTGDDADDSDAAPSFGGAGRVGGGVLLGAALGAVLTGLVLLPGVRPGPLLLVTALVLSVPLLFPPAEEEGQSEETTLYETETPYSSLRVSEIVFPGKRQPERRLYQNDETESGELVRTGAPTFAYIAAAERFLGDVARPGDAYLFLGGGAYTLPRRVAERDPRARITVVELDPEVTRVAYRFFGLRPEHGIVSVHGDARAVIGGAGEGEYDRVFVDVYDGTESVPYSLVTREAFLEMRRLLRPGGTLALNVIGVAQGEGERRFWSTVRTLADAFPAVALYYHLSRDFPDRQNFLLAASEDENAVFLAKAGGFERWPADEWEIEDGPVVFHDRAPVAERRAAAAP
jgi:hypothetical protein